MTIKEIEALSGMPRANIRFYESEEFISPTRGDNGYRDYSQDDLNILLRVKLLRSMDMPLEEIKAVHRGERELDDALARHESRLLTAQGELARARALCETMRADGVRYETLDASGYFAAQEKPPLWEQPEDILPRVGIWRRFFARDLDFSLYHFLWMIYLALVFDVNVLERNSLQNLMDVVIALALMVLVEPALLHWLGTTPGKWLLGIRVSDPEDGRLTYTAGFERVWCVLSKGWGWRVPVYTWIRMYLSAQDASKGEPLVWEENSLLTAKPNRWWRWVLLVGGYLLLYVLMLLAVQVSAQPGRSGGLTVAEYAANYNELAVYHGVDSDLRLDENGCFYIQEDDVLDMDEIVSADVLPLLSYELDEAGNIETVELYLAVEDGEYWQSVYPEERILLVWALNAEPRREETALAEYVGENQFAGFVRQGHKTRIDCDLQYEGYLPFSAMNMLTPEEGEERSFLLHYRVELY